MPDMQKVSIALTGEQVSSLKAAMETGEYATNSEAVREALREVAGRQGQRRGRSASSLDNAQRS